MLDAAPERPQPIDHDVIDALGAAADEGDLTRLVDSVGRRRCRGAARRSWCGCQPRGMEGITLIRAMLRRMALLARLRAEVERGNEPSAPSWRQHGKSLFWKEKDGIERQLRRWRADLLAKAMTRLVRRRAAGQGVGRRRPGRGRRGIVRDLPRRRRG